MRAPVWRVLWGALSAWFLIGVFVSAGWAASIPDQSVDATQGSGTRRISGYIYGAIPTGTNQSLERAQVFTVGLGGLLTDVEVMVGRLSSVASPLFWEIREVSAGGHPDSTVLADGSTPASAFPGGTLTTFPSVFVSLGGMSLRVAPGDILALLLYTAEPTFGAYSWRSTLAVYSGGSQFTRRTDSGPWLAATSSDDPIYAGFQTFVDPAVPTIPEPGTGLLFGLGLVGLAGWARRWRRQ